MSLGMLRLFKFLSIFALALNLNASVKNYDFEIIKKGVQNDNTLLIIGGIQGDEPGGFMAASLIATHYEITKGSVWVVPNLNFYSIIKRSRGPYGDMNRKFANISKKDPDYVSVKRIKDHIKDPLVKVVLNLHDGSGFYRKKFIDKDHSPYKWGQSSIIDQAKLDIKYYGNLEEISKQVCEHVNKNLLRAKDIYHVHNTKTRAGDKEMEKTLTYYAINNKKAAFGNEASKSLPVHKRTYYHLLALEKYMSIMGIEFKRKFDLNPKALKKVIDDDIYISFYGEQIKLPLSQVRKYLNYFPVSKNGEIEFKASNPLMTIVKSKKFYTIHYGNRRLAILMPDYIDILNKKEKISFKVDGKIKEIQFGELVKVNKEFSILKDVKYRVNVIGYSSKNKRSEAGIKIKKYQISKRFSIDKSAKIYRVEFYKKDKFAGMVLIKFVNKKDLS